jgi:hypothetical protein
VPLAPAPLVPDEPLVEPAPDAPLPDVPPDAPLPDRPLAPPLAPCSRTSETTSSGAPWLAGNVTIATFMPRSRLALPPAEADPLRPPDVLAEPEIPLEPGAPLLVEPLAEPLALVRSLVLPLAELLVRSGLVEPLADADVRSVEDEAVRSVREEAAVSPVPGVRLMSVCPGPPAWARRPASVELVSVLV